MTTAYVGKDGVWKQANSVSAGKGGVWVPAKVRLVGSNGKWVETHHSEGAAPNPTVIDITSMSYRAGGPLQGDLRLNGYGLGSSFVPNPAVGAYYKFGSMADYLQDFASCVPHGTTLPLPTLDNGLLVYPLASAQSQYISFPLGGTGFDLLGLMGSDATGLKFWEIGGKFKPPAWPASGKAFVYWAGTTTQNISVYFTSDGKLHARFMNGAYVKEIVANGAVALNTWCGFVFRHRPSGNNRYLELQTNSNAVQSIAGDISLAGGITGFNYWTPGADIPILVASGTQDGVTAPASKFFLSSNTNAVYTISGDGYELTNSTATFTKSAIPSGMMQPGTGKYYIEILNRTSYNVQFGVTDGTVNTDVPGFLGWCVATINGRKFAKQTGGGTNWTSAIPANATIGLVYDSNQGLIEVYVNGVSRGQPFAAGTITTPVAFIIGGQAQSSGVNNFNPRAVPDSANWTQKPAGTFSPFPYTPVFTAGSVTYTDASVREFWARNAPMISDDYTTAMLDPSPVLNLSFKDSSGVSHSANGYILTASDTQIIMDVPELPEGNYTVQASYSTAKSTPRIFTIRKQAVATLPMNVDFSNVGSARTALMAAHKQWGGANGGVSADNIVINTSTQIAELTMCGDNYTGAVLGVDRSGVPNGFNKRIGACLVTRDYFGPGRYRVVLRPLQSPGAANAVWSFHYEEGYPGSPLYSQILADGMHQEGNDADGYYIVRNHEIDIEFPVALKTDPNPEVVSFNHANFNTWQGEVRNWNVPNNDVPVSDPMYSPVNDPAYWSTYTDDHFDHGVNLADGNFHEIGYDWHLGENPRVEYYIDGVLKHTVYTHVPDIPGRFWVGAWFPSAAIEWAGRGAAWDTKMMYVKSISIVPFVDEQQYTRNVVETYPLDVYRDLIHIK